MAEEEEELLGVYDSTRCRPTKRLNEDQCESPVNEPKKLQGNTKKKAKKSVPQQSDDIPHSLPVLPREIIVEILSRLPVKSLIQFRCVSKSFKSLISDTQFVKSHLRHIKSLSKIKNPNQYQRITPDITSRRFLKSWSLCSLFDNTPTGDANVKFKRFLLKKPIRNEWVVGSCDGLLCVAVKQDFVTLLNPSTRVFDELPHLRFGKKSGSYAVFGFGYDSEIDDYKVVAVFCFQNKNGSLGFGYGSIVEVCERRTRSWRRIGGFEYGVPNDVSGKYVSGTLNWPVMREGDLGLMWIIVSFDLSKETYMEVMQPDYGELSCCRTLTVLNGWLCVVCDYWTLRSDLWVMKEYGMRNSWIKLVSIPHLDIPARISYLMPYCIADSGEILLQLESSLVIYNPQDGTFRNSVINGSCNWVDGEIYIESLVSPKAGEITF